MAIGGSNKIAARHFEVEKREFSSLGQDNNEGAISIKGADWALPPTIVADESIRFQRAETRLVITHYRPPIQWVAVERSTNQKAGAFIAQSREL